MCGCFLDDKTLVDHQRWLSMVAVSPFETVKVVRGLRFSYLARVDRERWSPGIFLDMPDVNMPFIYHATEFKYAFRMWEMFRTDISSESDVVDFSCCLLPFPLSFSYQIPEMAIWGQYFELEVWQRSKGWLVYLQNIELFAIPSVMWRNVYSAALTFRTGYERLYWFLAAWLLYFIHFSGLFAKDATILRSRVRRL